MRLNTEHNAIVNNTTIHPKYVFDAADYPHDIIKKSTNKKLGRKITKGIWEGMAMYTLTLVERETCTRACEHYLDCYMNNVAYAHRFKANQALMDRMEKQLPDMARKHNKGFVIRLHIGGDFYSVAYVLWWKKMLETYPNMRIYGYSRWHPDTAIGKALELLRRKHHDRFKLRFSNLTSDPLSANGEDMTSEGITCPVQTNKTTSCGTCGLCWTSKKQIRFLTH
jgi:hypothetical protein